MQALMEHVCHQVVWLKIIEWFPISPQDQADYGVVLYNVMLKASADAAGCQVAVGSCEGGNG